MKKIAILTSILALTACGGGSGGGGSGVTPVVPDTPSIGGNTTNPNTPNTGENSGENTTTPDTPNTPDTRPGTVSDEAIESNASVTGMLSEIGVAEDGTIIDITRHASRKEFQHHGKKYKSYNLEDVNFVMADEGFGGKMKFTFDEKTGEITYFSLLPDENDPEDEGMSFKRRGYNKTDPKVSKEFIGQVNHKTDDEQEAMVDAVLTYDSMGENLGLKYSDFGAFDIDVIDGWRPVFIGGYEIKQIDTEDIVTTTTFTGKATGSVMAVLEGQGSGVALPLNDTAQLVFDKQSQTSTLTASFDNWYDVEYVKSGDNTGNVTFTNGKNPDFYLINDIDGSGKTVTVSGEDIRYYGDKNNATEAVGLIQVRDCGGSECTNDYDKQQEVRMNLGFGGISK